MGGDLRAGWEGQGLFTFLFNICFRHLSITCSHSDSTSPPTFMQAIRLALAATQQELGHDVAGWIADLGYNLAGDVFYHMTEASGVKACREPLCSLFLCSALTSGGPLMHDLSDPLHFCAQEGLDLGPDPGKPSGSVLNALDYYIGDAR